MLGKLQQLVDEGTIRFDAFYFAYCKKGEQRLLAHADAMPWDQVDPKVQGLFAGHLYEMIAAPVGERNHLAYYTGETVDLSKVVSEGFDHRHNKPAVEIMEEIAQRPELTPEQFMQLGNVIAYKYLACASSRTYILGIVKFHMVPSMGAAPVHFAFASLCDLAEEREESYFDENKRTFATEKLQNIFTRTKISKGALFPSLDEDGREASDLLLYDGASAQYWWDAFECARKFSPKKESRTVVSLMTRHLDGEVPEDLFAQMQQQLLAHANTGIRSSVVADTIEKATQQPVDKERFNRAWEGAFGRPDYAVPYQNLFGEESQNSLTMQAADVKISLAPRHLAAFRQVNVDGQTYVVFRVPQTAKVQMGKDLDLKFTAVTPHELMEWMLGKKE